MLVLAQGGHSGTCWLAAPSITNSFSDAGHTPEELPPEWHVHYNCAYY